MTKWTSRTIVAEARKVGILQPINEDAAPRVLLMQVGDALYMIGHANGCESVEHTLNSIVSIVEQMCDRPTVKAQLQGVVIDIATVLNAIHIIAEVLNAFDSTTTDDELVCNDFEEVISKSELTPSLVKEVFNAVDVKYDNDAFGLYLTVQ